MHKSDLEASIEALMDQHSPEVFLSRVAEVLWMKGEHVALNRQDHEKARRFEVTATKVLRARDELFRR
jgi:hypothetical protein